MTVGRRRGGTGTCAEKLKKSSIDAAGMHTRHRGRAGKKSRTREQKRSEEARSLAFAFVCWVAVVVHSYTYFTSASPALLKLHHPERLNKLFIVGAPRPFAFVWSKLIVHLIPTSTREKITILHDYKGHAWLEEWMGKLPPAPTTASTT